MKLILIEVAVFLSLSGSAQLSKNDSLVIEFENRDSIFFERSFNKCDIAFLDSNIHPNLIFYHDQGGMQDRRQFLDAVKNNICGAGEFKPIRKADRATLKLFPYGYLKKVGGCCAKC